MTVGAIASIRRGYACVPAARGGARMVHYRVCGTGPAVVLLHDSPRSSRLHVPLMKVLASRFQVFALDTPGYGNSDPLGLEHPTIPDFAEALGEALDALGLAQAPLYATHTSAKIALALAVRGGRMPLLVLDGLSIPDQPAGDAFIDAYMRPFMPEPTGAWLAAEWSRTRDMLRWFPWFSCNPQHRIAMEPPSPEWMEDYGIDLFSAGPSYAQAYAAAMRWSPLDDLHAVRIPTIVGARTDDVLYPHLEKVPCTGNRALSVQRLGADRVAWAEWIEASLANAAPAEAARPQPRAGAGAAPAPSPATRGYVTLGHGQLHWMRHPGPVGGASRPLVILSAPSTLEAHQWAERFSALRPVIVPDLPGFGDSDPLPDADPDALADALAALVGRLEPEACDVLAIGLAAPIGARMAARRPGLVATLAIWGAPEPSARDEALAPAIAFDPLAGSHLHRFWHMLRDSAMQWPWHDARPQAARPGCGLPDAADLHLALTGMLKQRTNYAQAIAAALAANEPADWQRVNGPVLVAVGDDPAMAASQTLIGLLADATAFIVPADPQQAAQALHTALAGAGIRAQEKAMA